MCLLIIAKLTTDIQPIVSSHHFDKGICGFVLINVGVLIFRLAYLIVSRAFDNPAAVGLVPLLDKDKTIEKGFPIHNQIDR